MRLGIDLGGTKIEGIILDEAGQILCRRRIETPPHQYPLILAALCNLIRELEAEVGQNCSVGIGMPGSETPGDSVIRNSNTLCLNGKSFRLDVEERLGRKIAIANDANCFALSEAIAGAATNYHSVFGVILGTGVGGGLVVNKQLLSGANRVAGEWGHNPLPWPDVNELPGAECYCGKFGCIETYLSGPALAAAYQKQSGRRLTAKQVVALAEQEPAAAALLTDYEDRLARSLAGVINIFDPEAIVLGGGMGKTARLYENLPPLLGKYVFSNILRTKIIPPKFGDASGVRGAAWLNTRED